MTNFVQVIKACESAEGEGSKLAIRKALATMDDIALRLIWESLNVYRVYGVRKFDMPDSFAASDSSFYPFFSLLDKLHDRELTGNAARAAITFGLSTFTKETAEYLARVIDKDMKAGFSDETFNKVLVAREMQGDFEANLKAVDKLLKIKGFQQFSNYACFPQLVPIFSVQLADKCEDEEDFENIEYPCQADIKYDGERNIAVVQRVGSTFNIVYYSRSGKIAEHMNGLFDEELTKIHEEIGYDFILDGERFASDFTQTMNAKKSGNDDAKKAMLIRAYFLMPLSHWIAQETDITMGKCREMLGAILKKLNFDRIVLSEGKIVHHHQEMMDYCNHVINNGDEGLILKRLNDVYRWERTSAWTKIKRFYPVDLTVVGWYYGRPKSRLANVMGGVILEGTDEKGRKIRTRCGSGFSDEDRADPKKWENATIEVKYQEISMSAEQKKKKGDIYCLRFPTIERLRDDKDVEALHEARLFGCTVEEAVKFCGA